MDADAQLIQYFASLWSHLDERARRLVAASKAVELGYGGISRVSRACGLSRVTLTKGVEELRNCKPNHWHRGESAAKVEDDTS